MNPLDLWQKVDEVLRQTMATELSGSKGDPTNDFRVNLPPRCVGCGGLAHGGVNVGTLCLTKALLAARHERDEAIREVAAARALRSEVLRLPFDPSIQRNVRPLPRQ